MKQLGILLFCWFSSILVIAKPNTISILGNVKDKVKKSAISNASIYLPDLKMATTTDLNGNFKFENLPKTKILIQISCIGYQNKIEFINDSISTINIELEPSIKEISEIVITGISHSSEKNRTPVSISIISHQTLLQTASSNIIDALAQHPGISQVTTGNGISKPVIRGLGYNRVVVINDGIKQEGQQWGDEHGIEIDEYSVNKVEVLKGPASLSYGSDAMAGVINMISYPMVQKGIIKGNLISNYQTNNGLIGSSANISGNVKNIIFDVRFSSKKAHSYQNKYDGYVLNSAFKESSWSGIVGINKSWGYSHLHFSTYQLIPGIVEGERDSISGKFTYLTKVNDSTLQSKIADKAYLKSFSVLTPYQKVWHHKIVFNNNFYIKGKSVKLILGYQQNQRKEFADALLPNNYGLFFLMNTLNYDLKINAIESKRSNLLLGINGMQQSSTNKGTEFLIPQYNLFDFGIYSIFKKEIGKLDISGGYRFDIRAEKTEALILENVSKFLLTNNKFQGTSGSIGAAYQFSKKYFAKLNFSKGFRAPNIAELASNGIHEGSLRYEIGNKNLVAEHSSQIDFCFGISTPHITAELNLFDNYINNFIFIQKLISYQGGDSLMENNAAFKFEQKKANLYGTELSIDIHPHPLDWLHFENSFSYVKADFIQGADSLKNLPFIPAPRFQSEIKMEKQKLLKWIQHSYLKIGMEYNFAQNNIFNAYHTETKSIAYNIINAGFGADIYKKNNSVFSIFFTISNITNNSYQNHLSRLKYAPINYSTNRTGIYNMGRNYSLKIVIPIVLKKNIKA